MTNEKIKVFRRKEYSNICGEYNTHRVEVRVDASLASELREFVVSGKQENDKFILIDEELISSTKG